MSLRSQVERMYGIRIREIVGVQDVYRIRTATASYCLKRYDLPEEEVRFIARILSCLNERGYTRGQHLYATAQQAPNMTREGVSYTLTNWVHGQRPDFTRLPDVKKGIRTLAKFHTCAEGFPLAEAPVARIRYSGLSGEVAGYRDQLNVHTATRHLAPLCEEVLDQLRQPQALEAIGAEQQASAFVHGDYNYPNLVLDKRRKLHLIDFENSSLHARMKDLAHILHRNWLWNGSEVLRWIDYYHKYRPLSAADRHLLHALLSAPYHVVRNLKIGGIRLARRAIPTSARLDAYRRELRALL